MATAHSTKIVTPFRAKLRIARNVLIGLVALAILLFIWNFSSIKGQAQVGVAYGAHVACSCRYIEGRDLKYCESDFEDGMGMIRVSDDPEHKRVTASVPFLASAVAERRGKFGCLLLNEKEIEAIE